MARTGLVAGTNGNASLYAQNDGLVLIKPSGLACAEISENDLVVIDLEGRVVEGRLRPSIDTPYHLGVYRTVSGVQGILHAHSPYATAFAATGRSIPPLITAIADLFGGEIPCAPYVSPDEDLGRVLAGMASRYRGCLVSRHGLFAFGASPESALHTASVMEHAAKTVYFALQLGASEPLPADEVSKWHTRYNTAYGQQASCRSPVRDGQ